MKVLIHVDGWPIQIEFTGNIEIERLPSGHVACRRVSDDADLDVFTDYIELERSREFMAEIRARSENFMHFWRDITSDGRVVK